MGEMWETRANAREREGNQPPVPLLRLPPGGKEVAVICGELRAMRLHWVVIAHATLPCQGERCTHCSSTCPKTRGVFKRWYGSAVRHIVKDGRVTWQPVILELSDRAFAALGDGELTGMAVELTRSPSAMSSIWARQGPLRLDVNGQEQLSAAQRQAAGIDVDDVMRRLWYGPAARRTVDAPAILPIARRDRA